MTVHHVAKKTVWLFTGLLLATPVMAAIPLVDTGTMDYWDGNLPPKYIYKSVGATTPQVNTGTMDFVDETGLATQYIFETFQGSAPSVLGWYSVRTHSNGVGPLSMELSTSSVDSEPRRGGIQQIKVQFTLAVEPLDGTLADVDDVNVTGSVSGAKVPSSMSLASGNTALLINFNPGVLPDGEVYTFDISGKIVGDGSGLPAQAGSSSLTCQVRAFEGDINNDGQTNLIDVGAVKGENRQPCTAANAWADLNGDGKINLIDAALAKLLYGN